MALVPTFVVVRDTQLRQKGFGRQLITVPSWLGDFGSPPIVDPNSPLPSSAHWTLAATLLTLTTRVKRTGLHKEEFSRNLVGNPVPNMSQPFPSPNLLL